MNNSLKGEQYYHWGIGIDQHIGVGNQYKLGKRLQDDQGEGCQHRGCVPLWWRLNA